MSSTSYVDPKTGVTILPTPTYNLKCPKNVVDRVAEALKSGRRQFGSAGAFMSHQAYDPDYTSREGADSAKAKELLEVEQEFSKFLKEWTDKKPNAVVVESVLVPDSGEEEINEYTGLIMGHDLDFAVLLGNEVVMIDVHNFTKRRRYTVSENNEILMTGKPFPESDDVRTCQYVENWLDTLTPGTNIVGMTVINQENVSVDRDVNWFQANFRLIETDRFYEMMEKKFEILKGNNATTINPHLVAQFVTRCIRPYNKFRRVISDKNLREFK